MGSAKSNEFGFNYKSTGEDVLKGKDLEGKHFFITGAGSGIGREAARVLYNHNAMITIASLIQDEMDETEKFIKGQAPKDCSGKLYLLPLDLGLQSKVKECIDEFSEREDKMVDVLVLNAGIMMCSLNITKDGFEKHMAINHFGHFSLTMQLLERGLIRENGRIVVTSSKGHKEFGTKMHFDDLELRKQIAITPGKRIIRAMAYGQSKLAQLLFARELNRRLKEVGSSITSYSLHPGVVKTKLPKSDFWTNLYYEIGNLTPFFKNLEQGAATTLFLATNEKVVEKAGYYFQDCGISTNISREGLNDENAKRIFDISEERTGMKFPLKKEENKKGDEEVEGEEENENNVEEEKEETKKEIEKEGEKDEIKNDKKDMKTI